MTTVYFQGQSPTTINVNGNAYLSDGSGACCVLNADVAAVLALPNWGRYPVAQSLIPQNQFGQG